MNPQLPLEPGVCLCCLKSFTWRYKWAHKCAAGWWPPAQTPPTFLIPLQLPHNISGCYSHQSWGEWLPWERQKLCLGWVCIITGSTWLLYCLTCSPQVPGLLFEAEPAACQQQPGSVSCSCLQPCCTGAGRCSFAPFLYIIIYCYYYYYYLGSILRPEKQFWGCCLTATVLCLYIGHPPSVFFFFFSLSQSHHCIQNKLSSK